MSWRERLGDALLVVGYAIFVVWAAFWLLALVVVLEWAIR